MFLPVTKKELREQNIDQPDVILVSGDTYIDSSYCGLAVIGKWLKLHGYTVAIIAQPDINSDKDITSLGEPKLFWGITAGAVDSMVANYTALKKKIKMDDATPGEINDRRPDRAVIKYTNLIRRYFKDTRPIVIGGIEASLRRISHYDFWSDKVRKSIIFDSKADILVYGEGERTIIELAEKIKAGIDYTDTRGICYISKDLPAGHQEIPSHNEVSKDKLKFIEAFHTFYKNNDPVNAVGLSQKVDERYLIQNPPNFYLEQADLDKVYAIKFENEVHPHYSKNGKVKALETIRFSINSHRGCYGECNFCAIAVHQGRRIRSRSKESIIDEARAYKYHNKFKGIISDIGGATANMYENSCKKQLKKGSCQHLRCLSPEKCAAMKIDHAPIVDVIREVDAMPHVRKVFTGSGLRYDLVMEDKKSGMIYLNQLVKHHVSGQLKIAPEHMSERVLNAMAKPSQKHLIEFRKKFYELSNKANKDQYLTYYFIAAHPGCDGEDMQSLKKFTSNELKMNPEQVQIFTPTPSTYSSVMYYTGLDPYTLEPMHVDKNHSEKIAQKEVLIKKKNKNSRPQFRTRIKKK